MRHHTKKRTEIINGAKIMISDGKIRQGDERGTKQGKYVYTEHAQKNKYAFSRTRPTMRKLLFQPRSNGKPIYEVRNGYIIKDKQYKLKLADGYYIIRKLTLRSVADFRQCLMIIAGRYRTRKAYGTAGRRKL